MSQNNYLESCFKGEIIYEDHLNGKDFYEELFKKYNNYVIADKNGIILLVRNFKFYFAVDGKSIPNYAKRNPKYKDVVSINQIIWDPKTMGDGKYKVELFTGLEPVGYFEIANKNNLTINEILKLYDDRIIIDRKGNNLLVREGKLLRPLDSDSFKELKKNKKQKIEVRINQDIWDHETMENGEFDGGFYQKNIIPQK